MAMRVEQTKSDNVVRSIIEQDTIDFVICRLPDGNVEISCSDPKYFETIIMGDNIASYTITVVPYMKIK